MEAVDPTQWLTLFEVLEQTEMPYDDIRRLADEGLIRTRPSGPVVLFDASDVARVTAGSSGGVAAVAAVDFDVVEKIHVQRERAYGGAVACCGCAVAAVAVAVVHIQFAE